MNLTINMDKRLDAIIDESLCVNCDSCGKTCPVGAIKEGERAVEGITIDDHENILPSSAGCPLGIVPQVLVSYIKAGRIEEAAEYIYSKNPMAATCAAVCDQYCQRSDRRCMLPGAPINIRALEQYIIKQVPNKPCEYKVKYDEKIAVIGGGPAGIMAAHNLASLGYEVTIFERDENLGGAMAWGIPGFRLDKDMMDADIAAVTAGGIKVKTGVEVGSDITLEELQQEYDIVLLAAGASSGSRLNFEGTDGDMVLDGVSVLRTINLQPENEFTAVGDTVVVIGGGRFAGDVSRTLARKGKTVIGIAMEEESRLQLDEEYLAAMAAEGIEFIPQVAPKKVIRTNGQVTGIELCPVEYIPQKDGAATPRLVEGREAEMPCDTVVFAVGRSFDISGLGDFEVFPDGAIKVDKYGRTSRDNVFACGDVTGATNSVVAAMMAGRKTARYIDAFLRGRQYPKRYAAVTGEADGLKIIKDDIAMLRPYSEQRIFSRSSKMEILPAEDITAILRTAGIEENMPQLLDKDAEDYASKKKVAVIGGGIAGITAAIELAKKGYAPTLFEKTPLLGGRYRWLSTDKRINAEGFDAELAKVAASGIPVVCNASAGIKPSISELKADGYEAILFAIGETIGERPDIPHVYARGAFEMVSLASRLAREVEINGIGKRVIVTGSDQMAVDVARKLKEFTRDVTLISPKSRGELQYRTNALMEALEEGVNLVTGTELVGVEEDAGLVKGAEFHIIERDLTINAPCDTLIIGDTQMADTATIVARNPALKVNANGSFKTNDKLETPISGVLALWNMDLPATDAGKLGAAAVHNFFTSDGFDYELSVSRKEEIPQTPAHEILEGKTIADKGFEVGTRLMTAKQARREATRYLCVGFHKVDRNRCIGCGLCTEACPEGAIELVASQEVE